MTDTVKLAKLKLSPINVRTSDNLEIEPLAAGIAAKGILQNLLVTPSGRSKTVFEVFDGGRRLRALQLLAADGTIDPETFDVPVKVIKAPDAELSETSLLANFTQLRLTPAEECRAFQHFIGEGRNINDVARIFGQTVRFVEGRLRLASLATVIFDALADGTLTLEKAKAYASTESHEKQLRAFETYGRQDYYNADTIRRAIAGDAMRSTDPVALLIGRTAYEAAGGRIDPDLFTEDGDRWVDPEIAERVAGEIMTGAAQKIGQDTGLGWIRPIAGHSSYHEAQQLYRVALEAVPPTEGEAARMNAIDIRQDEIVLLMEDEGDEDLDRDALETEYRALQTEYAALQDRPKVIPEHLKPEVGAFLLLGTDGSLRLEQVYYSEKKLGADDQGGAGDRNRSSSLSPAKGPAELTPGGKPMSGRLSDELAVHRRDVLAAALIGNAGLALDFMLFSLADAAWPTKGTTLSARRPEDPSLPAEITPSPARVDVAEAREALDNTWQGHVEVTERFAALRDLNDDSKAAWLAVIIAASLQAKPDGNTRLTPMHACLAQLLDIDIAKLWRPTAENYFDRVSKGSILALLTEVGGTELASRYAGSKKSELSATCEKLFAGTAIVEAEIKQAALAWVPAAMMFTVAATSEVDDEDDADFDDIAGHADEDAGTDDTDQLAGDGELDADAAVMPDETIAA